jgi:hypothetical protein
MSEQYNHAIFIVSRLFARKPSNKHQYAHTRSHPRHFSYPQNPTKAQYADYQTIRKYVQLLHTPNNPLHYPPNPLHPLHAPSSKQLRHISTRLLLDRYATQLISSPRYTTLHPSPPLLHNQHNRPIPPPRRLPTPLLRRGAAHRLDVPSIC